MVTAGVALGSAWYGHKSQGTYNMLAGELDITGYWVFGPGAFPEEPPEWWPQPGDLSVGSLGSGAGTGAFTQTGGTVNVDSKLNVSNGSYTLTGDDSVLSAARSEYIGYQGTGTFLQMGGLHTARSLCVGNGGGNGDFTISGGTLAVAYFYVGGRYSSDTATGILRMTGSSAKITVEDLLVFSPNSSLSAVAGSTIRMTGPYAEFKNRSTDENALAGLEDLTLIFEGGNLKMSTFEVAGADRGTSMAGFEDNFVLGKLVVGETETGYLKLFDDFDNGNRSSSEALYVHDLTVSGFSVLDLNGINLYYDGSLVLEPFAIVYGGTPIYVPEPATLALLGLGGLGVILGRKRR